MAVKHIFEPKSMDCPEKRGKTTLLAGWEEEAEKKSEKHLVYIECKNPRFCWYGSDDCSWGCWDELEKGEKE